MEPRTKNQEPTLTPRVEIQFAKRKTNLYNSNMNERNVTNEMLYEFMREFKADVYKRFDQIDKRFDQQDRRMDQQDKRMDEMQVSINQRFDQQDKRMDEMQVSFNQRFDQQDKRFDQQDSRMDRMERKIDVIYECRHEVKVEFHWKLAAASVAISAGVSVVVFLAMSAVMG